MKYKLTFDNEGMDGVGQLSCELIGVDEDPQSWSTQNHIQGNDTRRLHALSPLHACPS
jgi:hypothetical protein